MTNFDGAGPLTMRGWLRRLLDLFESGARATPEAHVRETRVDEGTLEMESRERDRAAKERRNE